MQRTRQQEKAYHKGFKDISNLLIASGVSLTVLIQDMQVEPTPEAIKMIFRAIGVSKYGIKSTKELERHQIDECWKDLIKVVSEKTGEFIPFPSWENREEALQALDNMN